MRDNVREVDLIDDVDEYVENSMANAESSAKESAFTTTQTQDDDRAYDDLQYRSQRWTPDAKKKYSEINRDVSGGFLNQAEIAWARITHKFLANLIYLTAKGFDLKRLEQLIERDLAFALNISLSNDGFLRKNMNTQRMKFGKEIESVAHTKSALPNGIKSW